MFKNEDFERLFIRYKAEAMPNGVSIQAYCKRNGVLLSLFDYSDMTREEIIKMAVYLQDQIREKEKANAELMRLVSETNSMLAQNNRRLDELMQAHAARDEENKELRRQLFEDLKTIGDLNAELKLARKNRFGSRSDRNNHRPPEPPTYTI